VQAWRDHAAWVDADHHIYTLRRADAAPYPTTAELTLTGLVTTANFLGSIGDVVVPIGR
jgi:hypothetical protein